MAIPEVGARKLMLEAAGLTKNASVLLLYHSKFARIANCLIEVSKSIGIEDVVAIQFPNCLRAMTRVPKIVAGAIRGANALIFLAERMPEETRFVWSQLRDVCKKNRCKYFVAYDPKFSYLQKGGILANYEVVDRISRKIQQILSSSKKIHVTSDIGTSITFELESVNFRSPIFAPDSFESASSRDILVQVPEGEVQGTPFEGTFSGKVVVDGPITGMGVPYEPITWVFERGRVIDVDGQRIFLSALHEYIKRFNPSIESLVGHSIAEFAMGTNEWALFDENISNCEKVAGTVHFGIGHLLEREMFHMDAILSKPSVTLIDKNGKEACLIEDGEIKA